jgi:Spy/CpxP family protein refolding chaperone
VKIFSTRSLGGARALGGLVLLVTFGAGALSAAAVSQVLHAEQRGDEASRRACEERKARLLDEVGLTPDQQAAVEAILERRRAQTDRFWSEAGPELRAIMDSTRSEIRTVLTPEQRERYERLRAERKAAEAREDEARHGRNPR